MSCIMELVKGQDTYRADVGQSVLELVEAMVDRNIGAVLPWPFQQSQTDRIEADDE